MGLLKRQLAFVLALELGWCAVAHAQTLIFTESFEDPEIAAEATQYPTGWYNSWPSGHPSYIRIHTDTNNAFGFTTPYGTQAMQCYWNNGPKPTTDVSILSSNVVPGATYTLWFHVGKGNDGSASKGEYEAAIVAVDGSTVTEIAVVTGDSTDTTDMSYSNSVSGVAKGYAGQRLAVRLNQDPNRSNYHNKPLFDNVSLWITPDTTPPTLAVGDITDDSGGSVEVNNPVTYTLTFSEDMDPDSVATNDFSNVAGSPSTMAVDTITQTDTNVFDVVVTPTSTGNLQLRVSSNVTDWAGFTLADNVDDAETITVGVDSTAPQVESITDNNIAGLVTTGTTIRFTLTFNEYMDLSSFAAGDFANVSNAAFTVSSIGAGDLPSMVEVDVTADEAGYVQLRLTSGSVTDQSSNATDQNWDDATTITILDPDVVIYEPFADSDSTLPGNTPGTGLTGTWSGSSSTTTTVNQFYGKLVTIENGIREYSGWRNNEVGIDTTDDYTALLANGGEMWFSMLYSPVWANGSLGTYGRFAVGIGDDGFLSNGNLNTSDAQAIGFGMGGGKLYAGLWTYNDWGANNLTAAPWTSTNSSEYLSMSTNEMYLIVGHVQWGIDDSTDYDTVTIYTPDANLARGSAVAVSTGVVSQSSFNLLATHNGNNLESIWDEIRVGPTYDSVAATAVDKYWRVGSGDWDTTTANWSLTSGGAADTTWSDGDNAIIEGSGGGTITLAADVNISSLHVASNDYTITANTLVFPPSGVISNDGSRFVLATGVTGSPAVYTMHGLSSGDRMHLAPVSAPMILGKMYRYKDNYLRYRGSAASNTIQEIVDLTGSWIGNGKNNKNDMYGTADWSIGDAWFGNMQLYGGTLILTGEVTFGWQYLNLLSGASLHLNNPGAITQADRLRLEGGSLDNSSGSAITTSTYDPDYSMLADTEFIGSQGTNSDLTMGAGTVTMDASRTITVSNAMATFTIGGVIDSDGNPYSLTKEGAGTLALTGNNTYLGDTIINAGTVRVTQVCLSDVSAVRITDGALLHLDHAGTDGVLAVYTNGVQGPNGTWGAIGSGATNETSHIIGSGLLSVVEPTPVDGIRYWDGGTTNIAGVGNSLSDGTAGTWDRTIKNWDAGAGVAHTNWNNATNDLAFFRGTAGTVTLGENINLGHLVVDTDGYTVSGNTLNFAPGGMFSNNAALTITSGITGEPDVFYSRGFNQHFTLAPSSAGMSLGTVTRLADDYIDLGGTTTNNTIVAMPKPSGFSNSGNVKVHKIGSGTWTVNGELYGGQTWIYGGTLVCNGRLWESYQGVRLYSGTLIVNGTVERSVTWTAGSGYTGDGTLGGTGVCLCAISVPANGVLAPGYPTGTLTVSNACTISGTLEIELDGAETPTYSALVVDDALDVSSGTLSFVVDEDYPAYGDMVIASSTALTGQFAATNGLPEDATITYTATAVTLSIPYPSATLFLFQ